MSYDASLARLQHHKRLPTASGLTRALACPTSCVLPQVTAPPSPWSDSGRQLHRYVELLAKGKTEAEAAAELPEAIRAEALSLDVDAWPLDVRAGWRSEVAVRYDLDTDDAQMIDASNRSYGAGLRQHLYGTADLVRVHNGVVYVVDFKTGRGWLPKPSESGQLRFLALALARVFAADSAEVGHLRLTDSGRAWLDIEPLDALELATVREQLLDARDAVERETVTPKEGPWCRYCPAFACCPAKAALACASVDMDGPLTRDTAAAAWRRIKDVRAVLDRMEQAVREFAAREPVPLGDGWELAEVETTRETLDPRTVQVVCLNELGPDVAAASVELTATKSSLDAALKAYVAAEKAAGRKAAVAPLKRVMLDKVAAAGGVVQEVRREVKERRTKEAQP
jgi:hypothetical protein